MNRRHFLASALAAVALPAFVQAFEGDATSLVDVNAAFKQAASTQRKLLVFVVPVDAGDKRVRGQTLGEFLNYGPEASLARVAEVELVAATMADLRTLVPHAPAGEPLMVLVDPSTVPSRAIALNPTLGRAHRTEEWWTEAGREAEEKAITARIIAIAESIDDALPAPADVPKAHARYRNEILKAPIRGAEWSVESGCGSYIEGREDQVMNDCGMGHVSARSSRMLYFFEV